MASVVIYNSKSNRKKRRFNYLALTAFTISALTLSFFLLLPTLTKSTSKAAPKPQVPNHFDTYLNQTLDWEALNDFKLIIPKLDLNVDVKPSVDILNLKTWQQALKQGVAHAQGSSFPNQPGTTYIFGHSTDYPWNIQLYNALFYSLNDLNFNDQIFISYQKEPYAYRVYNKQIIKASDLSFLNSDQDRLVLQTCWPPGTTLKRLVIEARLVDN